jgi:hypothetical protein
MYCTNLWLCVSIGLLLFLASVVAFLRPQVLKAKERSRHKAIAVGGALALLIMAHCFDCANQVVKQYAAKTFHTGRCLSVYLSFHLMVAATLVLLIRFLTLRTKGDRFVGWILFAVGSLVASLLLLSLYVHVHVRGFSLGAWAILHMTPDKMLPFTGAVIGMAGLMVLLSPNEKTR